MQGKYLGIRRHTNDKFRYWNENCYPDQFDIADQFQITAIRNSAHNDGIPVYFLSLMDDEMEDGTLLSPTDSIPEY